MNKDINLNFNIQEYKGIPLKLINRNYSHTLAMRYTLNGTNQNVWIPKKHLMEDGTIKKNEDIDYVFRKAIHQLELSGIIKAIPGIKRNTNSNNKVITKEFMMSFDEVQNKYKKDSIHIIDGKECIVVSVDEPMASNGAFASFPRVTFKEQEISISNKDINNEVSLDLE